VEASVADHFFISYSSIDGADFALTLADALDAGPPPIPTWVDKRKLRPGEDWDEQLAEAIRTCKGLLFAMSLDSVANTSVCKDEWVRGLSYKKPIIPLLLHKDALLPFRLGSREYIDFTGSFESAIARLRQHFSWMDSAAGQLQGLKYRLADAQRVLPRAELERRPRIRADIEELNAQIAQQQATIDNPRAAEERVQGTIDAGLEAERRPSEPVRGTSSGKFINPPPLIAPTWFRDRHVETRLISDFLKDDALRLMIVVGRGGIGKSAMVCRLLRSLEGGQLPDDGGPLAVDGIVYLSDAQSFHRVNVPDLYASLTKLVDRETVKQLDLIYKNPYASMEKTFEAVTDAFRRGRTIVLMDNFEDALAAETREIGDPDLRSALYALLKLPPHGLKVVITTRVAPSDLPLVEPRLQRRLDLDQGLEKQDAIVMLQDMDADGKVGLKTARDALLGEAWTRTRGYPRALEHLFGILSADRDSTLQDILNDTKQFLPNKIVDVLVGEAFSRLDVTAQRVMQALAIYRYPVVPAAVDYLLQPYLPGLASGRVLSRLVNMQFARRDAGRYYLHQIDRDYALGRIPEDVPGDWQEEAAPLTQFALRRRAAEWFALARKPREAWKSLDDLAAQLSEFDLRCEAQDFDTAASVLREFDFGHLFLWGHYGLMIDLHERLRGRITDPSIAASSVGTLGSAYYRMGRLQQAMVCQEEALRLSRENNDREFERVCLGNLAVCLGAIGEITRAIDIYEQVLEAFRKVGDQNGEAVALANLAGEFSEIGQFARALDYFEQAIKIDREIGNKPSLTIALVDLGACYGQLGKIIEARGCYDEALTVARDVSHPAVEAAVHGRLGELELLRENHGAAKNAFEKASEIADGIGIAQLQGGARNAAALASLLAGDPASARRLVEVARQYHSPIQEMQNSVLLGVVSWRQRDLSVARHAFAAAVDQANALIEMSSEHYAALDAKAIALSGLALCGDTEQTSAARAAFQTARAITSAAGVVQSALQFFYALAVADESHVLVDVRAAAAGDSTEIPDASRPLGSTTEGGGWETDSMKISRGPSTDLI
jgi:tetratricopeptide (TPR) repeat protein